MKSGKNLIELANELERQKTSNRDFIAPLGQVELTADSQLSLGGTPYKVNEIAHNQISEYSNIPNKYYQRMLSQAPELLANNVNHWFSVAPTKQRMLRTLDGNIRAFLSDKYRPLDNYDLAEIALPSLTEAGCRVESCEITESKMYIKAVAPKLELEVKKGDYSACGNIICSNAFELVAKVNQIALENQSIDDEIKNIKEKGEE